MLAGCVSVCLAAEINIILNNVYGIINLRVGGIGGIFICFFDAIRLNFRLPVSCCLRNVFGRAPDWIGSCIQFFRVSGAVEFENLAESRLFDATA